MTVMLHKSSRIYRIIDTILHSSAMTFNNVAYLKRLGSLGYDTLGTR